MLLKNFRAASTSTSAVRSTEAVEPRVLRESVMGHEALEGAVSIHVAELDVGSFRVYGAPYTPNNSFTFATIRSEACPSP